MKTDLALPYCETARQLAVAGQYTAAVALLNASLSAGSSPTLEVLLLQAKILAQQGDLRGAAACWQRVLDGAPDHAEAAAGLRRARRAVTPIVGPFFRYSVAFLVCLLFAIGAFTSLAYAVVWTVAAPQSAAVTQSPATSALPDQITAIEVTKPPMVAADVQSQLQDLQRRFQEYESRSASVNSPAPVTHDAAPAEPPPELVASVSQLSTRTKKLEQLIEQLRDDYESKLVTDFSRFAGLQASLTQLTQNPPVPATPEKPLPNSDSTRLRELESHLEETLRDVHDRRIYQLGADAQQWMFLYRAYARWPNSKDSFHHHQQQQIEQTLRELLDQIERAGDSRWQDFLTGARKFLEREKSPR